LDSNINCPLSLREVLSARLIKKGQTVTVLPDAKRAKETVSVEAERPKTPRRTPREARRSQQTTRVESDRSNSTFPAGVRLPKVPATKSGERLRKQSLRTGFVDVDRAGLGAVAVRASTRSFAGICSGSCQGRVISPN
ncbi:hypothetical protein KCU87_g482, partial [Aureobasidium melanogenum]